MVVLNLFRLASSVLALGAIASASIVPQSFSNSLHRRQITSPGSDIPAQCQSACATLVNLACPAPIQDSCLCTPEIDAGIKSCYDCAISTQSDVSSSLVFQISTQFFEYQDECNREGFAVPSLTLSAASNVPAPTGSISVSSPPPIESGSSAPSGSAPGATSGSGKISAMNGGLLSLVAGVVVLFV